jgi:IS5 family transposase
MVHDRDDSMRLFVLVPALSLAMESVLAPLDQLLEDDMLVLRVKVDLRRGAPHTAMHGRPSTPVEGILRMLVVKRWYHRNDEETEPFVADRLVLQQFCQRLTGSRRETVTAGETKGGHR